MTAVLIELPILIRKLSPSTSLFRSVHRNGRPRGPQRKERREGKKEPEPRISKTTLTVSISRSLWLPFTQAELISQGWKGEEDQKRRTLFIHVYSVRTLPSPVPCTFPSRSLPAAFAACSAFRVGWRRRGIQESMAGLGSRSAGWLA